MTQRVKIGKKLLSSATSLLLGSDRRECAPEEQQVSGDDCGIIDNSSSTVPEDVTGAEDVDLTQKHVVKGRGRKRKKRSSFLYFTPKKQHTQSRRGKRKKAQQKTDQLYCVCRAKNDGRKYWQCEQCYEWYHPGCVGFSEEEEPDVYICEKCQDKRESDEDVIITSDTCDPRIGKEDRFITVCGKPLYIEEPEEVSNEVIEDSDGLKSNEDDGLKSIEDSDEMEVTGDNTTLFKHYTNIMDDIDETVNCDNKQCDIEEHKRHHLFCYSLEDFLQHGHRCHNFGRNFYSLQDEQCLTLRLTKDLNIAKPDPTRSTGTIPIQTIRLAKDGSVLSKVLTETKMFSGHYIRFVILKDYMVRHISIEKGIPLELAEEQCLETEINTKDIIGKQRK